MKLTAQQQRAVHHGDGNLQLIACAGSGKTEVVARRVVHLLDSAGKDPLKPANIIAFTFTDRAAGELKERIVTRCREAYGDVTGLAEMFVGTIRTAYKRADSGYISAWYLDEDYNHDCFVDCQMFFDFKKAPNLRAALKTDLDPDEFKLQLLSQPFPVRGYGRVAAKVVDVYGNESTAVRDLPHGR